MKLRRRSAKAKVDVFITKESKSFSKAAKMVVRTL